MHTVLEELKMHNNKEATIGRKTKVIDAAITETFTRFVRVEVPIDISTLDLELLGAISRIPIEDLPERDGYDVSVCESNDPPEYRLEKPGKEWRAIQLTYDDPARLHLARLHDQLARSWKGSDDLKYNRVAIELPGGRLTPGCIYYLAGHAVVIAAEDAGCRVGLLCGFDHCYPGSTEALALPWRFVEEIEEVSLTMVRNLPDMVAEWLEDDDPSVKVERSFSTLITEIVYPTPQRAVGRNELYYRLEGGSDESDVTR